MFIDQQTILWDGAALSATGVSTNTYDCGTAGVTLLSPNGAALDPSVGEPLAMIVSVTVAAASNGTQTYEFDVIQSAAANLGTPTTLVKVPFTTTQAATLLTAGSVIVVPIPPGSITQRYIGGNFIGANTPTITITAWLAAMRWAQMQKFYATAIVVD